MCNPRKLEVKLTGAIDEEWREEIAAMGTASQEVVERVERAVPLRERFGAVTQPELLAVLREGPRGWQQTGAQTFTLDLGEAQLFYDHATGLLRIVAEVQEVVTATATASVTASARVQGELDAVGEGHYDDDGSRTRLQAEEEARRNAEAGLAARARVLQEQQTAAARADATARALAEAQAQARTEAETRAEAQRQQVQKQVQDRLLRSADQVRAELAALVCEVTRRGVLQVVRANGGTLESMHEDEDTIHIKARL